MTGTLAGVAIDFLTATHVEPAGAGRSSVDLDSQWTIGAKMHGGYLLAVLARAATESSRPEQPHLTAVGASFVTAPTPGVGQVQVDVLREGRSATQLRAQLHQDGQLCVEALITQGRLTDDDPTWTALPPPALPDEAACVRLPSRVPTPPFDVRLMDAIEVRVDPELLQWAVGKPAHRGLLAGWQRLADGTEWDPASLLVALDAAPPVSFDLGLSGWAPTIQLSAYVRRLPAPGPLRFRVQAGDVGGERMDETAHAWDSKGRLVAQATQLAGVRLPA